MVAKDNQSQYQKLLKSLAVQDLIEDSHKKVIDCCDKVLYYQLKLFLVQIHLPLQG